jgi:hypothetical protein
MDPTRKKTIMKEFSDIEFYLIKKIMTRGISETESMQMFSYDESETKEENNRQYDYHYKEGIKELIKKPRTMSEYEFDQFLEKLL